MKRRLFLTPEDILPVVALALLAGLRGPRVGRAVLFALPAAWLAGSLAGLILAPRVTMPAATAAVTIVLGALVAADRPLPLAVVAGLAIALGLLRRLMLGCERSTFRRRAPEASPARGGSSGRRPRALGAAASLRAVGASLCWSDAE